MGRPMLYDLEDLSEQVYDLLAERGSAGMTKWELTDALEVPVHVTMRTIRHLRKAVDGGTPIAVTYRVQGNRRMYFLTTDSADLRERDKIQLRSKISQADTETRMWGVMVAETDGRSVKGRHARVVQRSYNRVKEDLTLMYESEYGPLNRAAESVG